MLTEPKHDLAEPHRRTARSLLLGWIRLSGQATALRRWLAGHSSDPLGSAVPPVAPVCVFGTGGEYRRPWPASAGTVGAMDAAAEAVAAENLVAAQTVPDLAGAIAAAGLEALPVCLGPEGIRFREVEHPELTAHVPAADTDATGPARRPAGRGVRWIERSGIAAGSRVSADRQGLGRGEDTCKRTSRRGRWKF